MLKESTVFFRASSLFYAFQSVDNTIIKLIIHTISKIVPVVLRTRVIISDIGTTPICLLIVHYNMMLYKTLDSLSVV